MTGCHVAAVQLQLDGATYDIGLSNVAAMPEYSSLLKLDQY